MSVLLSSAWWRAVSGALLRTALVVLAPMIPALVADPAAAWLPALLTVALAVVVAIGTTLTGLPDPAASPWWELALIRALRTLGQAVVAGAGTAVLLTDVPWSTVLPHALAAAVGTLVLAAIQALPTMTPAPTTSDGAAVVTSLPATASTTPTVATSASALVSGLTVTGRLGV